MSDSPCHFCPDNPCKMHDTCERYQKFHNERRSMHKKKDEERAVMDATCLAIRRCKRKR